MGYISGVFTKCFYLFLAAYVPYPPEIHSLVADYESDVLTVEWTANSTSMLEGVNLTCEMNVLRDERILVRNVCACVRTAVVT